MKLFQHHHRPRYDGAEHLELMHSRHHRRHEAVSRASSAETSFSRSRVSPQVMEISIMLLVRTSPKILERSTKAQARAMTAATVAATRAAGSAAIDGQTPPTTPASVAV